VATGRLGGADPIGQRGDAEIDTLASETFALSVQRLMLVLKPTRRNYPHFGSFTLHQQGLLSHAWADAVPRPSSALAILDQLL
jgi:hypothetical protein